MNRKNDYLMNSEPIPGYRTQKEDYSSEQREIWKILVERQNRICNENASNQTLEAIASLGINPNEIETIETYSERLYKSTGWTLVPVNGALASEKFLELLTLRAFPISVHLRLKNNLEFTDIPDFFHDIYGHVPMLFNSSIREFLSSFGDLSKKYLTNEKAIDVLRTIFWFTAETGLIREKNEMKIYGASALTSSSEVRNIYENKDVVLHSFDVEKISQSKYDSTELQTEYFVLDSYQQLFSALDEVEEILKAQTI